MAWRWHLAQLPLTGGMAFVLKLMCVVSIFHYGMWLFTASRPSGYLMLCCTSIRAGILPQWQLCGITLPPPCSKQNHGHQTEREASKIRGFYRSAWVPGGSHSGSGVVSAQVKNADTKMEQYKLHNIWPGMSMPVPWKYAGINSNKIIWCQI